MTNVEKREKISNLYCEVYQINRYLESVNFADDEAIEKSQNKTKLIEKLEYEMLDDKSKKAVDLRKSLSGLEKKLEEVVERWQ